MFEGLKKKRLSQKKRKITLSLILKRLLTLVSYIFYPRSSKDLNSKPVESHQHLHYNSCHTERIKNLSFKVSL